MTRRLAIGTLMAALAAGCGNDSETPTSPSTTSTTTATVASPTVSEDFVGTVGVGGSAFYSFSVEQNGTVNVTFTAISGNGVPGTAWMGLGLGVPSGEECPASSTVNAPPGSTVQLTGAYAPGVYCARIADIGNLFAPAAFAITIAHP
jgi:hypothetical protein